MSGNRPVKVAAILGAWMSLLSLSTLHAYPPTTVQERALDEVVLTQCPTLRNFLDRDDWRSHLFNPVLRNERQVEEVAGDYAEILQCVDSVRTPMAEPEWLPLVRYQMGLFLSFAGSGRAAESSAIPQRQRVDLSTISDPAVLRLREDVGLRPPEGLVFVRYFADRERMPENIQLAFESPQTQAVTMSARYVAVLTSTPRILSGPRIVPDALQATFSHELVHAFLNGRLDWNVSEMGFPRWFHEGMAIHFSGSGRGHVEVDLRTGGLRRTEPTAQYEQYARVFEYLESRLGQLRFYAALRDAVGNADATRLIDAAGASSYEGLLAETELWWRWWPVPPVLVRGSNGWLFAGLVLVFAALGLTAWRHWQPAVPGSALEVELKRDFLIAVQEGDLEEVGYLLKSGADVHATDADGWSVLKWAVWFDRPEVTETLLNHGARVTPEIRRLADAENRSPHIIRMLADAAAKDASEIEEF